MAARFDRCQGCGHPREHHANGCRRPGCSCAAFVRLTQSPAIFRDGGSVHRRPRRLPGLRETDAS